MGRFSDQAEERFKQIRKRPTVPDWAGWVSGLIVIIFIGSLFWDLAAGDNTPNRDAGPLGPGITVPVTVPGDDDGTDNGPVTSTTTSEGTTSTGPGGSSASEDVELSTTDGRQVNVPAASLKVAAAGTIALFTGDWGDVPLATGASQTNPIQVFDDPDITSEAVKTSNASTVIFEFTVDPDGRDGPQPPRKVTAVAVNEDGSWRFRPNG